MPKALDLTNKRFGSLVAIKKPKIEIKRLIGYANVIVEVLKKSKLVI